jgi:hypothetical protein
LDQVIVSAKSSFTSRLTPPSGLPADEQITTARDLLVNKKTANELGLKISESLLLRADEVIE